MQAGTIFDLFVAHQAARHHHRLPLPRARKQGRLDDRVTRFSRTSVSREDPRHLPSPAHPLLGARGVAAVLPGLIKVEREGRLNFVASRVAKEMVYEQIHRERPDYDTAREASVQRPGFILPASCRDAGTGAADRFCHERIFRPLGCARPRSSTWSWCVRGTLRPSARRSRPRSAARGAAHRLWRGALRQRIRDGRCVRARRPVRERRRRGRPRRPAVACWRGEDDFVPADLIASAGGGTPRSRGRPGRSAGPPSAAGVERGEQARGRAVDTSVHRHVRSDRPRAAACR